MSYLGPLRLHFAGRFRATTSSVNNDPTHFDNSTWLPSFQELQGPNMVPANGWFDPRGDADFGLIGCHVTSAFLADGSPAPASDPVRELMIADSDHAAPAKIVDLDPCQQMVSMLFGLEVRITDGAGAALFRGTYEPAAFFDIWQRAPGKYFTDENACAYYQSVLTALEWGDISRSPFLTALRNASPDRLLSIKFMVDGYNTTFDDAEFTRGRIVGTIGPGSAIEPRHLVRGRQFVLPAGPANTVKVNFCAGVVDPGTSKVYLDLGNALPTTDPGGDIDSRSIGALSLFIGEDYLCPVAYQSSGWYEQTAGVVALPADRPLTAAELQRVATSPMSLSCAGQATPALVEAAVYVRPDQFVFRCDPGDAATIRLYATKFGRPHAGATIRLVQDSDGLQPPSPKPGKYQKYDASWTVGSPASAVSFPGTVTTDGEGVAVVTVATSDPGSPRVYIDGQVYGICPTLADAAAEIPADPASFVSLLVWSGFRADDPPTWYGSIQPVFQQYANLYPIMQDFLDLSCYDDVCAHRVPLLLAFGLPAADPNSMPVTRDLSSAKRAAILRWLSSPGADGKPLLGTPPPAKPAEARPAAVAVTEPADAAEQLLGGKGAAFRRMSSRKVKP